MKFGRNTQWDKRRRFSHSVILDYARHFQNGRHNLIRFHILKAFTLRITSYLISLSICFWDQGIRKDHKICNHFARWPTSTHTSFYHNKYGNQNTLNWEHLFRQQIIILVPVDVWCWSRWPSWKIVKRVAWVLRHASLQRHISEHLQHCYHSRTSGITVFVSKRKFLKFIIWELRNSFTVCRHTFSQYLLLRIFQW